MITSNMKKYIVYENIETLDQLGQVSFSYNQIAEVECSVFLQEQHNKNDDIRYREATHIGITRDRLIRQGYKLESSSGSYEVILVPQIKGRFTTLVLKEV